MKKIIIHLDKKININQGSSFHGFLIGQLENSYAKKLHEENLRPYSQYLENINEKGVWCVNIYEEEAESKILPMLNNLNEINNEQKEEVYKIERIVLYEDILDEMFSSMMADADDRYITVQFVTPTAFKQNEQYFYFPDIKLIFQSILNKYNCFNKKTILDDETFLIPVVNNSYICDYKIMTKNYYVEHTKIKGFVGRVTIKVNGPMALVSLAHFILKYGTYTGVGIKTAMGMGGFRILKQKEV